MAQIYPQPAGFSFAHAGPIFGLLAEETEVARIDATATAPIAVNDQLTFNFWILDGDVNEIRLYHGATLVETISNAGPFSVNHTADNASSLIRFESGPDEAPFQYLIGGISVARP